MYVDDMYIKCFNGKFVKVMFIASSTKDANYFMETNTNCGVIKEVGSLIFIAHNKDLGIKE